MQYFNGGGGGGGKNMALSVVQHPNTGLGGLIVEVSRSHTIRQISQTVGLFWTSDQPVAEAATNTTHNKHKGRTSMFSVGLEPTISAIEQLQTYAWDRTATRVGGKCIYQV
jgi:hypothetical protein